MQRQLHVRLPDAQPDIANEDIADRYRIFTRDMQFDRSRGGRFGLKRHLPSPIVRSLGLLLLAAQRDGDFFSRYRRAPHGQGAVPLQNHAIAENRRQLNGSKTVATGNQKKTARAKGDGDEPEMRGVRYHGAWKR